MTELTITIGGRKVVVRDDSDDLSADDMVTMFASAMIGQTYLERSVVRACSEYVESIKELEK